MIDHDQRPTEAQRRRSREWLQLWMVVASAAVAVGALGPDSFVPGGLVVIGLVVLYVGVFVVRLRRSPRDEGPRTP